MKETRKVSEYFGELTFNKKVMSEKLNRATYKKLVEIIAHGEKLDPEIADEVANAMKEWALTHGATHFTHWFQPQRGVTAEKHDSFISFVDSGDVIERFSGKQLIQSEPDASSFPSGGMRSTFEARGYTAWDPSSPAFIMESEKSATLVVPTVYLSYRGEVLDLKTPLLRSLSIIEKSAFRVLKLFGNRTAKSVVTTVGPEQEYFLIDKSFYEERPDLIFTGRTLIGASPAKGQQLEDHYFGNIKPKILNFMEDFETVLFKRGIPAKTRHNEVAPNQFEIAPIFEEANLAIDHNLQLMEIMRQVADEHGFSVLFHEKPFLGINGSGKHLNWSMMDSDGNNLLEPASSPKKNIQFLFYLAGILVGVNKFGGLLRMAVADAGNDHRLGANEAPPAIMSVFLGDHLNQLLGEIEKGELKSEKMQEEIDMKVKHLPAVAMDNSDRNRTSPIAFTGNKFEFRAVGSSQNCSEAATLLNLIIAYGLDEISDKLEKAAGGADIKDAALKVIKDAVKETKRVRFEGNNYSEDWHKEAEKRGLPSAKNTPDALKMMTEKDTVALFTKYEVLTAQELHAKLDIKLDLYVKTKIMELDVLRDIAYTKVMPAVSSQLKDYSKSYLAMKEAGVDSASMKGLVAELEGIFSGIEKNTASIQVFLDKLEKTEELGKKADILGGKGVEILAELRSYCDRAEALVDDNLWQLPKYSEMLFLI